MVHAACYDWLLSYAYDTGRYRIAARTADTDLGAVVEHLRRLADLPAVSPPTQTPVMLRRAQHERVSV